MNKRTRTIVINGVAVAVFALVFRLFIWPTFEPYVEIPSFLPEKNDISSISVSQDANGKWIGAVKYSYGGKVEGARLTVLQYALPQDKEPLTPSIATNRAARGTNAARIEILRPDVIEAVKVTRLGVALVFASGAPLAYKEVPVSIDWPDRNTASFNRELASVPRPQVEAHIKSLIEAGDTPSMLKAQGLAKALLRSDLESAAASQALVFIQTHAVWSPEGVARIDSRKTMRIEVINLENANAFDTIEELVRNLKTTKSRMPGGQQKLATFYQAASENLPDEDMNPQVWSNMDAYSKSWLRSRPESVVAKILRMKMLHAHAWHIRGGGLANSVTPEQWVQFHNLINESIDVGLSCTATCSSDPEWYATMITSLIDHSTTDERIGPLFVEGQKKFPDYPPIFVNVARKFTPKWGGSAEVFEQFARQVASQYPSPRSDEVYAIMYSDASTYGKAFEAAPVSDWKADCARWMRGLKSITSKFPTATNVNSTAYLSAQCGDKRSTREYLKQIAGKPDLYEWGWEPEIASREYARVVAWAR